jgi:23S rRNA (uracil1939-C5)-methyltransferase
VKKSNQKKLIRTVTGLTAQGQAFIDESNQLIKLPGFLPGDKVEVLIDSNGNVTEASLFEPSGDRVKPDCYFHGPCGGCDLLELSEKGRKKEKQNMIRRALLNISGGDEAELKPFLAAKNLIRYRPRVRLHQGRNREDRQAGYLAAESFQRQISGGIVPVTSCAIITEVLNKRLVAARKILSQIPVCIDSLVLMSSSSENSDRVTGHVTLQKGKTPGYFRKDLLKIMRAAQLKGMTISGPDGKVKEAHGSVSVTGLIAPDTEGGPFEAEPSFFVQSNVFQNRILVSKVLEYCRPNEFTRIIEGFSGAGNFTIPLAKKGARIEAIESHPGALRTAEKNFHIAGVVDMIKLIPGDAAKELPKLKPSPDVLLLDPPRTGTPGLIKILKNLNPRKIVYVFCDLDTMVRDSNKIVRQGYKLQSVCGIDLYPRTHHVETICLFTGNN